MSVLLGRLANWENTGRVKHYATTSEVHVFSSRALLRCTFSAFELSGADVFRTRSQ
jgi:hypothetical protein